MDPVILALILLAGLPIGWITVYLILTAHLLMRFCDSEEMSKIRRFFAPVAGLSCFITSVFVVRHEWPLLKLLAIPVAALCALAVLAILSLVAVCAGICLPAWKHSQPACTLPIMKLIKQRRA